MRAVIRRDRKLVCDEIGELTPGEGQVLVSTLACGICGSDLHALHHMEHMIDLSRRGGAPDSGFDPRADTVSAMNSAPRSWIMVLVRRSR
jgi:hypothetical protein